MSLTPSQRLVGLLPIFQSIRGGAPWQFQITDGSWVDAGSFACCVSCAAKYGIRLKPADDAGQFSEQKADYAVGKSIQFRWPSGSLAEWHDCPDAPQWDPLCEYRTKPGPEYVPLEPADVPPGSAIRRGEGAEWYLVLKINERGVATVDQGAGTTFTFFTSLDQANWQILRPGCPEWQPCRKEKGGAQ